jgi:hypothetical protein
MSKIPERSAEIDTCTTHGVAGLRERPDQMEAGSSGQVDWRA